MKFTLHIDGKRIGIGSLAVDEDGSARMWRDERRVLAVMDRVRLRFVGAAGMMLDGYEPHGSDRAGKQKFRHAEWWLTPVEASG